MQAHQQDRSASVSYVGYMNTELDLSLPELQTLTVNPSELQPGGLTHVTGKVRNCTVAGWKAEQLSGVTVIPLDCVLTKRSLLIFPTQSQVQEVTPFIAHEHLTNV